MIKILIKQGSSAWFEIKAGRIGGTRFAPLMSGGSTKGYNDLITDMAGELITGEVEEGYSNAIMERGIELEPEARKQYIEEIADAEEVGFCMPDEDNEFHEWIGVSPDGLGKGGLEIKCPLRKTHLNYIEKDVLPNEYKWQVQGQLFVTELPYCDFVSYYPGMKLFVVRIYPDKEMHEAITLRLKSTIQKIKDKISMYEKYDCND